MLPIAMSSGSTLFHDAAYGGVYLCVALAWLWLVDGVRPTPWDWAGALVALSGMALIMFQPQR